MSELRLMRSDQGRLSRRGLLAGLALAGAGALVACGGGGSSGGAPAGGAATSGGGTASNSATVKMTDANKFDPDTVTITKGGTVTWQNTSTTQHSVTCDPSKAANKADAQLPSGAQPFDSGLLNASATFQQTFNTSGTYKYFCIPHESLGMLGTVIVQ
jgi:plastocyanin